MIQLIAPREKVLPWLAKQEALWRSLAACPIGTDEEWVRLTADLHRAYQVLFAGLKRGFSTTEQEELNANHVLMRSAYVGELGEQRSKARDVYVSGMLELIHQARAVARGNSGGPA